jgi:hypothetical protein
MTSVQHVAGMLEKIEPARTFIDGQLFRNLTVVSADGRRHSLSDVFCTEKLLQALSAGLRGDFYFWHSHLFALRTPRGLVEDIAGVRRSFLYRDARLLAVMAASVVLLPYALWVVGKRTRWALNMGSMRKAIEANARPADLRHVR